MVVALMGFALTWAFGSKLAQLPRGRSRIKPELGVAVFPMLMLLGTVLETTDGSPTNLPVGIMTIFAAIFYIVSFIVLHFFVGDKPTGGNRG